MPEPSAFIRSPSYPGMPLHEAVAAVAKIEGLYRAAPVDRLHAAKLIGFSALSGPAGKALADLAAYGLLERAGKGAARVTERARDILHASSEQDRKKSLRDAALEPPLFRNIRERFSGISLPPEDGVITHLNRQGFNPNAVRPAAKAFLQTMRYLEELGESDSHSAADRLGENGAPSGGGGDDPVTLPEQTVKLGDYVQWTQDGADRFRVPLQVVNIYPDGKHAQVFGSPTGIPMSELTVVDPPNADPSPPPPAEMSQTSTKGQNDYTVYQRGNRLQITADVDLDGIATLKDILDDYARALARLAGKRPTEGQR